MFLFCNSLKIDIFTSFSHLVVWYVKLMEHLEFIYMAKLYFWTMADQNLSDSIYFKWPYILLDNFLRLK